MRSKRRRDYGGDVCHGWFRYHYALKTLQRKGKRGTMSTIARNAMAMGNGALLNLSANTIMQGVVRSATLTLILTILMLATPATKAADPPLHSRLFKPWINGVSAAEPQMQVQRYDDDTYVIRQSIRTNFEGPFLYVLFGSERVLLIDTGAGGLKVRPTIDRVIAEWAARDRKSVV